MRMITFVHSELEALALAVTVIMMINRRMFMRVTAIWLPSKV